MPVFGDDVPVGWIPRRSILGWAGIGGLVIAAPAGLLPAMGADEYDGLRERYREMVAGPVDLDSSDADISKRIQAMDNVSRQGLALVDQRSDRPGVFTDLPLAGSTDSSLVTETLTRLLDFSLCFATPGSAYRLDPELKDVIVRGMTTVQNFRYNTGQAMYGNWWDWQIGAPSRIVKILTLLYGQIPYALLGDYLAAIDHFVPDPAYVHQLDGSVDPSTGANRIDLCLIVAVRGILGRSSTKIALARDRVPAAFKYAVIENTTTVDGLYRDGSYLQHTDVAYTGGYGQVLLSRGADVLALLAASTWQVMHSAVGNLEVAVDRAYARFVFDGAMMSLVRGRHVSSTSDHGVGAATMLAILRFAKSVDAATAARWRGRVRGWVDRCEYGSPRTSGGIPGIVLMKELYADTTLQPLPEPTGAVLFAEMDRVVHRAPGWAMAISMASTRVAQFEAGDGYNKHGWHLGSGVRYLHRRGEIRAESGQDKSFGHFSGDFWPTVDPYRLPGITVDSQRLVDLVKANSLMAPAQPTKLTGGTTVRRIAGDSYYNDGRYAAVVHHEAGWHSSLRARMSWFFLADTVVCLGSGISGGSGNPIESIIENRMVPTDGTDRWWVNGVEVAGSSTPGWSATVSGVQHLTLPGTGGYVFLGGPRTVKALRQNRTGAWSDIKDGASAAPITRGYLTAWLDHGSSPADASYAYLLAPGADVARTAGLAADPGVRVVANTTTYKR